MFDRLFFPWAPGMWIGLEDILNLLDKDSYYWVDNSTTSTYQDWAFPTLLLFRCVMLFGISGKYQWFDTTCNTLAWCLCEKGLVFYK